MHKAAPFNDFHRHGRAERIGPDHVAEAIAVLRAAADRAAELGCGSWTEVDLDEAKIGLAARRHELIGWAEGSRVVGCCIVQSTDPTHWPEDSAREALYLHKLAVIPEAWGTGIGASLITFAGNLALERKRAWLRLDTLPGSRLVAYYERLGFRADPRGPATYGSRWLLRMEQYLYHRPIAGRVVSPDRPRSTIPLMRGPGQ